METKEKLLKTGYKVRRNTYTMRKRDRNKKYKGIHKEKRIEQ